VDLIAYNRAAWDRQVARGNVWTLPVGPEIIAAARRGDWSVVLTERKPVPREWFPPLAGLDLLCLAGGGGQQAPIFAAAGAKVTVFDLSPAQLAQDRLVAQRESLDLTLVEGDMRDLSALPAAAFDLVFHPLSNVFCPDVAPVWREAHRVLRPGGALLAGFMNPAVFLFDWVDEDEQASRGMVARHRLPFAATDDVEEWRRLFGPDTPLEFSHSLEAQIGGQLAAGFALMGLYEDQASGALGEYLPAYIATRARKAGS